MSETTEQKKGAKNGPATSKTPAKRADIPMYTIFKDGNGYEYRIANMANPLVCPREGIMEIEVLKKTNAREARFAISNTYDPELGVFFGVPLGIDSKTKEIRWQRFVIGDFRTYDLSKHADAVEWAIISRAPWLQGSAYQKGKPWYKKHDKEAEAREIITRSTIRSRAMEIATKMTAIEDMMDMYRNFGKNPEGFSLITLQAEIIKIAERDPKGFVDSWENKNRPIVAVFTRSLATGLISFDINKGGFMWKNSLAMGMTEQSAQQFLFDNKNILNQAELESKQKDTVTNYMKKTLSDAERKFFGEDNFEEDVDLIELRMTAKIMGVEGAMHMNKGDLQRVIDERSTQ